ncbi:hypothetical protein [Halorubrum halophilum]|uniref:hypothetical protein n=1 Tax=Halorubrum halophilum TaxID=413816 RepID=UPI00186B43FF|nr:hypothetical protein [Halorubrum halophilum]
MFEAIAIVVLTVALLGSSGLFYFIIGSKVGGFIWVASALSALSSLLVWNSFAVGVSVGASYLMVGWHSGLGFWRTLLFGQQR